MNQANQAREIVYLEQPILRVIPLPFSSVVIKRHLSLSYFLEIFTILPKGADLLQGSYLVELTDIFNYFTKAV